MSGVTTLLRRLAPNRTQRTVLIALALALVGALLVVVGVTQTDSPAAAPLPPTTVAAAPVLPTYAYPTVLPPPESTAPSTSSPASHHVLPTQQVSRLDAPIPVIQTSIVPDVVVPQTDLKALSIRIPALGVTASIGTATVVGGVLTPPRIPDVVGEWSGSAPLDAKTGEVTLAGHVNWGGMPPFAFGNLAYLHPGNVVYTSDAKDHVTAWRITSIVVRNKDQSIDPAAFGGNKGPRRLAMITCGGAYDVGSSSYIDNVYAYAQPA